VVGSVLSRAFAAILSWSEHCAAAFFAQGAKNYTDVKLVLLYRLILETHIIFVRKNNFLSPSVYCPDTSKRVPRIVTATGTEWRNRFVRDWIESSQPKMSPRQITALHPPTHVFRLFTKNIVKLLKTLHSIQFVLHFDPAWQIPTYTCAPRGRHAQTEGPAGRDRYGLGFMPV